MKKISVDGRSRVVIDRILPAVENGGFPLKRVIGDLLRVEAHLIVEGHEKISARFGFRHTEDSQWSEVEMEDVGNDVYAVDWEPDRIGIWEYTVMAWSDPFENWLDGFRKKAAADDPMLPVELDIAADITARTVSRLRGEDRKQLKGLEQRLRGGSQEERMRTVFSLEFLELMRRYPDRSRQTQPDRPCLLILERELAVFSTWYEFFPRSCGSDGHRHGTFRDAAEQLAEVARMGFQVVYLPPIHPIGVTKRKGRNNALEAAADDVGSPWAIGSELGGHKAIHPDLGGFDDFAAFVSEAQRLGLEVALDIAFQCSPDHPYVREHPQWFRWRPDGTVQYAENPPKKYEDILPFNFDCDDWRGLWEELRSVFDFWIEKGVKIFRVDNPHTKPFPFWRWCVEAVKREHPEVIFLSEAFTRPKRKYWLGKCGFTQGYTYFTWRNDAAAMRSYVEELTSTEVRDYFWPNFWPNTPDILHEDLQKGTRATFIARYVMAATLVSNTGIYGPAFEVLEREPFPGKEEYNNNEKYELKQWNRHAPGNIVPEITRINRIRRHNRALQRTVNIKFADTDNPQLLAYVKQDFNRGNQLIIVVSFDGRWTQSGHVVLPIDFMEIQADQQYTVCDLLDPRLPRYTWTGARNFVQLDPNRSPAHIFRVER